jgi:hypothetical protein
MSRFGNSKKEGFLTALPTASIYGDGDRLTTYCKFNFAYFTAQDAGQTFSDWNHGQLAKLLDKLKDYSKESLTHWRAQRIGGSGGTVLSIYDEFPKNSDFKWPTSVPNEVKWGRFRLESSVRLVGFILPEHQNYKRHHKTELLFDCNTFYVVFLDANHVFYKTETP